MMVVDSPFSVEQLGHGVTLVSEPHEDGRGEDYVFKIDEHELCTVGTCRGRPQIDLYETTGLQVIDIPRVIKVLLLAVGKVRQLEADKLAREIAPLAESLG